LAYGLHAGPHKDWSDLAQWQAYAPGNVRATTIGEMLNVIRMHFLATNGRMGNE